MKWDDFKYICEKAEAVLLDGYPETIYFDGVDEDEPEEYFECPANDYIYRSEVIGIRILKYKIRLTLENGKFIFITPLFSKDIKKILEQLK